MGNSNSKDKGYAKSNKDSNLSSKEENLSSREENFCKNAQEYFQDLTDRGESEVQYYKCMKGCLSEKVKCSPVSEREMDCHDECNKHHDYHDICIC